MNIFEKITASPESLAALLGTIPAIETPWDEAFHRPCCSSCAAADCDASEIDKYAVLTTQHNYPSTIQIGDAFNVRRSDWSLEP